MQTEVIELEHAIRAACTISKDRELLVFGMQVIYRQFSNASAELRKSIEVDVNPKNHPKNVDLIDGKGAVSPVPIYIIHY